MLSNESQHLLWNLSTLGLFGPGTTFQVDIRSLFLSLSSSHVPGLQIQRQLVYPRKESSLQRQVFSETPVLRNCEDMNAPPNAIYGRDHAAFHGESHSCFHKTQQFCSSILSVREATEWGLKNTLPEWC